MTPDTPDTLRDTARRLGLYGLLANWPTVAHEDWLPRVLDYEEAERRRRSLDKRLKQARIGTCKTMADFDWQWPQKIDRPAIEDLFSFEFAAEAANVVLVGPNGVGKTMIAQNLAHQALLQGLTVRFTSCSEMLHTLARLQSDLSLHRYLQRYCQPQLLVVDEVGYLSYDTRYADLLFEVVTRRYQHRSIVLTTNKAFSEWNEVFPNAACVVTLIDRLVHRAEILSIDGESYRLKERRSARPTEPQPASDTAPPATAETRPLSARVCPHIPSPDLRAFTPPLTPRLPLGSTCRPGGKKPAVELVTIVRP
jgi:DNA replication protein DnaC